MKDVNEEQFYKGLQNVIASGTEEDAHKYVRDNLQLLSEESRTDLMMNMFTELAEREARERDAVADIQERGIAAIERLDELKKGQK